MREPGGVLPENSHKESHGIETVTDESLQMFMKGKEKEEQDGRYLYFPLGKLASHESIFEDPERSVFSSKFKHILIPILGKQLAVSTYYSNDLIAPANTRISLELLRIFDELKINFKVNRYEITEEERDHALITAMTEIMKTKREFIESIDPAEIPSIQKDLNSFIKKTLGNKIQTKVFQSQYEQMQGYLEFANSIITSENQYVWTAAALKKVVDNERRIFNLGFDKGGETIQHVIKTTWISLMLAKVLDEFNDADCHSLSLICLGHDGGKALIPEEILYKKGRLTQLENDIMKSHVLLSYVLSSNNQEDLSFEPFVMALHHIKENKVLPYSYGIIKDTHTSFYDYLTPPAQVRLNEIYHKTKRFYRVISIADTFEAISAERVYKKASSIGETLNIMINSNKKEGMFHQPYLDAFVKFLIQNTLPKNMKFEISDEILDIMSKEESLSKERRNILKNNYEGVIITSCATLETDLECVIFDPRIQKVKYKLNLPPMLFLKNSFFD